MATTLCFDFGNTRMKCAVFTDGSFLKEEVMADDSEETIRTLLDRHHPGRTILSSVINHNPGMETLLRQHTKFHRLGHQSKLPVTTPVGKPETIGADRLALVVAAVTLFPGKNNLVIGLGSAITYNYVNKYCEFIGGGISPGMEMRFKSLNAFTAKLPLVKADWNFPLAGYDTRTNILSGVILGMAKEVDGMIEAYEEKYDNFNVLLSGGDGVFFTRHLKKKIFADPYLIYKGLYAISEYNQ
ncbi:MAG TPA: type III pantothenate kinase [Puia sp.]|uniref:type III pantothenate kinase n=1 Tax=Puia sp. TaxID=2045100 RepID=UPI002CD676EA|nr:type III pantothenate kinase [Puia sp.]HVU98773.1 type III pantothenate kinase [Puia sp.]